MSPKEFLNQAYWLDRQINSKLEQLSGLQDLATKATGTMSGDVVSHSRNVHSLQDVIAKIIDMQEEINTDIDRLVNLKQDIMHTIKSMKNPEQQTLLELRYLCFKSWENVAKDMGVSVRHVFRLHDEAIHQIIIPETCQ